MSDIGVCGAFTKSLQCAYFCRSPPFQFVWLAITGYKIRCKCACFFFFFFFSIYQAVSSFKSSIIYIWLGDPVTTTTRRNKYFFNWFNKFAKLGTIHISKNTLSSCKYKILNRQIGRQTKNKKLDKLSAQVGFGMLVSAQEQEWHGPSREKQWIWKITGYWMFFSTPLLPLQIWFPTLGSRFSGDR